MAHVFRVCAVLIMNAKCLNKCKERKCLRTLFRRISLENGTSIFLGRKKAHTGIVAQTAFSILMHLYHV